MKNKQKRFDNEIKNDNNLPSTLEIRQAIPDSIMKPGHF